MTKKIRVLVVEDSAFMRLLLSDILGKAEDIEIVGSANDGLEGVEKVKELQPDVVLMDMNMGEFDGLYAVKRIMAENPRPILILSAVGNLDLQPIFEALHEGAVDYMNKPSRSSSKIRAIDGELISKIRNVSKANLDPQRQIVPSQEEMGIASSRNFDVVVIGASTGGPAAVEEVLKGLPGNTGAPVIVCQHMPGNFIKPFVDRLNGLCRLKVMIAQKGMIPQPGQVLVAPGDANLVLVDDKDTGKKKVDFTDKVYKEYNNPSINALFESVASSYGHKALGVLLTGMGKDGARGLKAISENGGFTVAQNQASSVIFGMPKAAVALGAVHKVLGITQVARFLLKKL